MIGRLAGRIVQRGTDHVLIDVGGVGYVVQVSQRTRALLPETGEAVALWTELLVRDDALTLVGFPTLVEKEWHRLLMTVQGVGSKAAMAILGTLGAEGIGRALALGDWSALRRAPGVGPKTAQRVLMELKDKAPALMALAGEDEGEVIDGEPPAPGPRPARQAAKAPADAPGAASTGTAAAQADALSALTNLGYAPSEAVSAIARAAGEDPAAGTPALIRAALRLLAPGQ